MLTGRIRVKAELDCRPDRTVVVSASLASPRRGQAQCWRLAASVVRRGDRGLVTTAHTLGDIGRHTEDKTVAEVPAGGLSMRLVQGRRCIVRREGRSPTKICDLDGGTDGR